MKHETNFHYSSYPTYEFISLSSVIQPKVDDDHWQVSKIRYALACHALCRSKFQVEARSKMATTSLDSPTLRPCGCLVVQDYSRGHWNPVNAKFKPPQRFPRSPDLSSTRPTVIVLFHPHSQALHSILAVFHRIRLMNTSRQPFYPSQTEKSLESDAFLPVRP